MGNLSVKLLLTIFFFRATYDQDTLQVLSYGHSSIPTDCTRVFVPAVSQAEKIDLPKTIALPTCTFFKRKPEPIVSENQTIISNKMKRQIDRIRK